MKCGQIYLLLSFFLKMNVVCFENSQAAPNQVMGMINVMAEHLAIAPLSTLTMIHETF